jgi:hypothetical protein
MTGRPALVVGALLALVASSVECRAQSLEEAASNFARRWDAGEAAGLESSLSRVGVRFQWESRPADALDPGHAAASIREYLQSRVGVATRVTRVEEVGGDPPTGYAEFRWESRIQGTSDMLSRTVFVAFVREDGAWLVTEVRVFPLPRP